MAALSSGKQAGEEGRLVNPVIYDKVPEYFAKTLYDSYGVGDSIPNFHLRLLNADGSEKDLSNIELYLANQPTEVSGYDSGGKMTYTDGYTNGNASQKAFADLKPDSDNTFSILFTVYELRLRYADDHDKDFVCSRENRSSSATQRPFGTKTFLWCIPRLLMQMMLRHPQ